MRILAVDFGTSTTVAAVSVDGGPVRLLTVEGEALMPSAVFLTDAGTLAVGRDAERQSRLDPSRYEPNPKRRIDDGEVLLGISALPVVEVIADVLRRVAVEARTELGGPPDQVRLTHPARWGTARKRILTEAASQAGLLPGGAEPILIPEPVAAASHFAGKPGLSTPDGATLAVYDLGAGTFDVAVLRKSGAGWEVVTEAGLPDLGGLDFENSVVEHIGIGAGIDHPDEWTNLRQPKDAATRRLARAFTHDVKESKEALSRVSHTDIAMPDPFVDVHLTRNEFERLIQPQLDRTTQLLAGQIERAGVTPDQLTGIYLVGGSSRIPLVANLIHQRLGVEPSTLDQPETAVASGALLIPGPGTPATGSAPVTSAGPASGGFAVPAQSGPATGGSLPASGALPAAGFALPAPSAATPAPRPATGPQGYPAARPQTGPQSGPQPAQVPGPYSGGQPATPAPAFRPQTGPQAPIRPSGPPSGGLGVPATPSRTGGTPPSSGRGSRTPLLIGVAAAVVVAIAVTLLIVLNRGDETPTDPTASSGSQTAADVTTGGPTEETTADPTQSADSTEPVTASSPSEYDDYFIASQRTYLGKVYDHFTSCEFAQDGSEFASCELDNDTRLLSFPIDSPDYETNTAELLDGTVPATEGTYFKGEWASPDGRFGGVFISYSNAESGTPVIYWERDGISYAVGIATGSSSTITPEQLKANWDELFNHERVTS